MHLSDFSYDLPVELIAQHPLLDRDAARLLVVDRTTQKIRHHQFSEISQFLPPKSLIVLNDSKVIPARLIGNREKSGGRVEIFLLKQLTDGYFYEALIRPLGRLKTGEKITFGKNSIYAQLIDPKRKIVRFNCKDVHRYLSSIGHIPLPPYIKRPDTKEDHEYYQTVYARKAGSVAAPTAGLHFTTTLLKQLTSQGHLIEKVTLHVNYGTFSAVKEEEISKHSMHVEEYFISKKSLRTIESARTDGRKIIGVGTTSCRVLETLAVKTRGGVALDTLNSDRATPPAQSSLKDIGGTTNIFIYPGYIFKWTDILLTNFHLPQSTLLMLVYAFASPWLMKKVYQEAIALKYRFYSYGDAMLIL